MIHLRPYQTQLIDDTRAALRQRLSPLIVAPTGSGKTALTAAMLGTAAERGNLSWFLVHRQELIDQAAATFRDVGIDYGVISATHYSRPNAKVQICGVQTLVRRIARYRRPDLLVMDEAHHTPAGSWQKILERCPGAHRVGLTATPERLDGKGLAPNFNRIILGPSTAELIEQGYLARYRIFAPSLPSLAGVHTRAGDYAKDELQAAVDKPSITGDAIKHYRRLADGKRAIAFCVSREHSKHVAAQFQAAGIAAVHVDGETDTGLRRQIMAEFRAGKWQVLCNVDLFGEGIDVPALEAVILLRPTQSLALYMQQVGRSLRPFEGKDHAIIVDHAGCCHRHGLPDDLREWRLEGADIAKRRTDGAARVRQCQNCYAANPVSAAVCRECGTPFPIKPRVVRENDGELREVTAEEIARRRSEKLREEGAARTLEDWLAIARTRGHRPAWAYIRYNLRSRRRA